MPYLRAGLQPNTNKAVTPSAYSLDGLVLITSTGERLDIQDLATSFTITESIFANGLILKIDVKDTTNIIETYRLLGHEKIEVYLSRTPFFSDEETRIQLSFIVSEYPLYGKGVQQNTQAFTIVALSPHIYFSKLQRISRPFRGTCDAEITKILTELKAPVGTIEKCTRTVSGVFPLGEPMFHANYLAHHSFSASNGAPYFLYQTLQGLVHFRALDSMCKDEPLDMPFNDKKLFTALPQSKEDYLERSRRILSFSSDYRVSKIIPALGGAYAATNVFVDAGVKKIQTEVFKDSADISSGALLNSGKLLDPSWEPEGEGEGNLESYEQAHLRFHPVNSLDITEIYQSDRNKNVSRATAFRESLDTFVHTIVVPGEFDLNAGTVIDLDVLKSVDFSVKTDLNSYDDLHDTILSGRYLVTSVVHSFGSEYTCAATIKKNSI